MRILLLSVGCWFLSTYSLDLNCVYVLWSKKEVLKKFKVGLGLLQRC